MCAHRSLLFIFVCLCLLVGRDVCGLGEGDECTVKSSGKAGVCRLITECPDAIIEIQQRRSPTICAYKGFYQVVCCARSENVNQTPPRNDDQPSAAIQSATRISAQKCNEYQTAVYEDKTYYTISGNPFTKKESVCNMDSTTYIIDGEETTPWEFPHMTLIGYGVGSRFTWECGGSLISELYVLTAAHCVRTKLGPPTKTALGMHSVSGQLSGTQFVQRTELFDVADAITHPSYKSSSNYNDIGLIRMRRTVRFSPYIRPACLPVDTNDLVRLRSAVVSGWGHTEFRGAPSDKLMKAKLDLFSAAECNATYTQTRLRRLARGVDGETQMCAGSRTERKDSCQGDSGGPLQIQHPDVAAYCMYSVQGVVSFGMACGGVNTPAIYTRVWAFVPWIEGVVW